MVLLAALVIAAPTLAAASFPRMIDGFVASAIAHPFAVFCVSTIFSFLTSAPRAARARSAAVRQWTGALPATSAGVRFHVWVVAAAPSLLAGVAALSLSAMHLFMTAFDAGAGAQCLAALLTAEAGLLTGSFIGTLWAPAASPPSPPSRYVPRRLSRGAHRATLSHIAAWAWRAAFACAQPRLARRTLLPVLLLLPSSLSGAGLLLTVLGLTCLLAAVALACGLSATLRKAFDWTASLPVTRWQIVLAATRRAVPAILLATLAGMALLARAVA